MITSATYVFEKTREKSAIMHIISQGFFKTATLPYEDVDSTIKSWMSVPETVAVYVHVIEDGKLRLVRAKTKEAA